MTDTKYFDGEGNPCTLFALCKKDPAWAAQRIERYREDLKSNAACVQVCKDIAAEQRPDESLVDAVYARVEVDEKRIEELEAENKVLQEGFEASNRRINVLEANKNDG